MFDNLAATAARNSGTGRLDDEISAYLKDDCDFFDDVISWWRRREKLYPRLARMALDFQTIPGEYRLSSQLNVYLIQCHSFICRRGACFFARVSPPLSHTWPVIQSDDKDFTLPECLVQVGHGINQGPHCCFEVAGHTR